MARPSLLALLLVAAVAAADDRPLFDGKSLDGWVVEGARTYKDGDRDAPIWVTRDGMISCMVPKGGFGFLRYSRQQFGDFRLRLEYRFAAPADAKARRGNSGIGIRTVPFDPKKSKDSRPSFAAYEIQLLDDADRPASKHSTASLYRYVAPSEQAARPAPQWNTLEVECVGPRIRITLNGKKVIDVDQTKVAGLEKKPLKGYICLQNHGSRIDFRNIKIHEIPSK
jgi:hypothetical protein